MTSALQDWRLRDLTGWSGQRGTDYAIERIAVAITVVQSKIESVMKKADPVSLRKVSRKQRIQAFRNSFEGLLH